MVENLRKPAVSGMFYPSDKKQLEEMIQNFLDHLKKSKIDGNIKAIISPHAGYKYSGPIAAHSYKALMQLDNKKHWKILLLGPSHQVYFKGAALPEHKKWQTPLGNVDIKSLQEEIGEKESFNYLSGAGIDEHSLEVQVPFLQKVLKNFTLYPLVLGEVDPKNLADDLKEFCKQDDVIIVVSSDLSHYLSYDQAKEIDLNTNEAILSLDYEKMQNEGDACGKNGILTLIKLSNLLGWKCKLLDYRNSGDTAGEKDKVVGYGAWVFYNK